MSDDSLLTAALLKLIDETNEGALGIGQPERNYYFRDLHWRIKHYRVLRMRFRDKMTYFEISEVEKCTVKAVMRRIEKALVYLSAEAGVAPKSVKARLPFVFRQQLNHEQFEL